MQESSYQRYNKQEKEAIEVFDEFIKDETLATKITFEENKDAKEEVLNGHDSKIFVKKA